jgi:flavin-binding protein dodecin
MAVAKVIEISAGSPEGFEQAIQAGVSKAGESVRGIKSAWVQDHEVKVDGGTITEYRVNLKVTFVLE